MLVHLKTHKQISDHWPVLRELIKEKFREEVNICPSYTNNILTHALLNIESFQLCLHYFDNNLDAPASFFILDMGHDSLIEKRICSIPLWVAIRMMHKREVLILAKELVAWIKGNDCELIRAQGYDQRLMANEVDILKKMGLIKETKNTYGWYAYI